MRRGVLTESLHLLAGLGLTTAFVRGAVSAYPPGRTTIEPIGWAAMLAVLVMALPRLIRAWRGREQGV